MDGRRTAVQRLAPGISLRPPDRGLRPKAPLSPRPSLRNVRSERVADLEKQLATLEENLRELKAS